jgi:hypothetical protein
MFGSCNRMLRDRSRLMSRQRCGELGSWKEPKVEVSRPFTTSQHTCTTTI